MNKKIPQTGNRNAAAVIARLFKVTPDYVRKLNNGIRKPKNGPAKVKADNIIAAYKSYIAEQKKILKTIKKQAA